MRHHHHPILTIAIWFKRHPEMTLKNLCPICLQPFAFKLPVLSGAEVINFAVCSQIFGSESANVGIDAGGAALDSPQNVLADVPVLPLCCPRQRLWAPEDRRMLPSHEGGGQDSWLCSQCHRHWQVSHQFLQTVLPHRCSCPKHGRSTMVVDMFSGHSKWSCVVGDMRETVMPVPCMHISSRMEIEAISMGLSQILIDDPSSGPPSMVSSSGDEIMPDT